MRGEPNSVLYAGLTKMHLTGRYINWRRVWLTVLVGYVLLIIVSNLAGAYIASYQPWLIDWQDNPEIRPVSLNWTKGVPAEGTRIVIHYDK